MSFFPIAFFRIAQSYNLTLADTLLQVIAFSLLPLTSSLVTR